MNVKEVSVANNTPTEVPAVGISECCGHGVSRGECAGTRDAAV